ncbi:DUF4258 domain-containing protein [Mesorhizobium sp. PUT5]|uniref:DUF4258 domain-containing protein n=1 Tax=Mesorhizobium sp. PUT5 TaxID=3454629 RepID=UPI003FA4AD9B
MGALLARILELAEAGKVRVSAHGLEELANDDITFTELLEGLPFAIGVEEYGDYHKGPCILVLQAAIDGSPVHVLWGIARNAPDIATLITAYRPDPDRWNEDFLKRKPR